MTAMATRKEVADRAGVSVAVVSYVLNNRDNVKPETRRKVLEAIQELGYRPNQMARSLKTKVSKQIAVLIHYLGNPFEAGLLLHIENEAKRHGYFVFVQTFEPDREEELRRLLIGRVDGVLLLGQSLDEASLDDFAALGIPVVSAMQPASPQAQVPFVDVDWTAGMRELIAHLRAQGHRRIAFMSAEDPQHHYAVRYDAFGCALREAGLTEVTPLSGGGRFEQARLALLAAFSDGVDYTAVVCANDLMAAGCLAACRERGAAVPQRLAIAGCEDILMSSQTWPPLTALQYPRQPAGVAAMQLLLRRMNGEAAAEALRLPCPLVVRASTDDELYKSGE